MDSMKTIFCFPSHTVDVSQKRYSLRAHRPEVAAALDLAYRANPWVRQAVVAQKKGAITASPSQEIIQFHSDWAAVFEHAAGKTERWLVKRNFINNEEGLFFVKFAIAPGWPIWMAAVKDWPLLDTARLEGKAYGAVVRSGMINPLRVVPAERARQEIAKAPEAFNKVAIPDTFLWELPKEAVAPGAPVQDRLIPVEQKMDLLDAWGTLRALSEMSEEEAEPRLRQLFRLNAQAMLLSDLHIGNALLSNDSKQKMVPIDFEPVGGMRDRSHPSIGTDLLSAYWDPRLFGLIGIRKYELSVRERVRLLQPNERAKIKSDEEAQATKAFNSLQEVDEIASKINLAKAEKFARLVQRVANEEVESFSAKYRNQYILRYSARALFMIALWTQWGRISSLWKAPSTTV